ncbi:hypothetical protein PMIN06_005316 [Paraphaeosphaeria minitans]
MQCLANIPSIENPQRQVQPVPGYLRYLRKVEHPQNNLTVDPALQQASPDVRTCEEKPPALRTKLLPTSGRVLFLLRGSEQMSGVFGRILASPSDAQEALGR